MNKRIRELAEQVDLIRVLNEHAHEYGGGTFENTSYPELEKFAELIRADEREACARVAEEWLGPTKDRELHIAAAIRARGEK